THCYRDWSSDVCSSDLSQPEYMNTALPRGRRPCVFSHALTSSMVTELSASLLARPLMSMTAAGTIRLRTGICSRVWVLAMKWHEIGRESCREGLCIDDG